MIPFEKVEPNPLTLAFFDEIDNALATLKMSRPFPPEVRSRIRTEFLPDRVTASLNIEGIGATRRQTLAMMDAMMLDSNSAKAEQEILNALKADDFVYQTAISDKPLSLSFIREVNGMLLEDLDKRGGSFRDSEVQITGASFQPPSPVELLPLLQDVASHYNSGSNVHPIIKAAWLHSSFTYIHPFVDGNGRTGRLLQDFSLLENGYYPTGIPSHKRDDYYDALGKADGGDFDELVSLICDSELSIITRIQGLVNEHKSRGKMLQHFVKSASSQKQNTDYKQYLVWRQRFENFLNQLESFSNELSEASDEISIYSERYPTISFEVWQKLKREGKAHQTWALSQNWRLDGQPLLRTLLYFDRHMFRPEDPVKREDLHGNVSLKMTATGLGQDERFNFARYCDNDISFRQLTEISGEWLYYQGTGETVNDRPFVVSEVWSPEWVESVQSDIIEPLVTEILSKKGGLSV